MYINRAREGDDNLHDFVVEVMRLFLFRDASPATPVPSQRYFTTFELNETRRRNAFEAFLLLVFP